MLSSSLCSHLKSSSLRCQLNAKSLLITRADAENISTSNHADQNVLNYDYDIIIQNNGDLIEFARTAIHFVEEESLSFQSKPVSVNLYGEICYC